MNDSAAREFRESFLIYCLELLPDGTYIALNRQYKPIGFTSRDRVEYETAPGRFQFKSALSEVEVGLLSFNGDSNAKRIQLYNDGCIPTDNPSFWIAYSERLERLARYQVLS